MLCLCSWVVCLGVRCSSFGVGSLSGVVVLSLCFSCLYSVCLCVVWVFIIYRLFLFCVSRYSF